MNVGRGNGADLAFKCSICMEDGYIRGQFGGRSLVNTSCPAGHVFHLECITGWLESEQQLAISLDQRECVCRERALPLIRLAGMELLGDESPYCETRIFNACRTGNLRDLRMLLRENEALANRTYHSVLTGYPEHLLAVAIKNEHTDLVRLLIDYHADVNAAGHDGELPLHIAARLRRTEDLIMLISAGADINNVLRTAVREGDAPLLEYFVSTQPGQLALSNALYVAAEWGQTQCLKSLINLGAKDLNGALYAAVLSENIEGRRILEQHGANIITVLHTAARQGSVEYLNDQIISRYINEPDEEGQTPLHITAANGHGRSLEKLLETRGVDVNAANKNGETALHLAVYNGHVGCLIPLIEKGVNLNATNKNGETALHIATKISISEGRQQWADMGRDINETFTNGRTPEHYTNKQENGVGCLKELIAKRGVTINVADNDGITPLMIAALWGKFEHLTWLIDAGADINAAANCGTTALGAAACCGRTECLKKLLDMKADINAKTHKRRATPLHMAADKGHTESMRELLADGRIQVNEKQNYGGTALHYAACKGHTDCVKALLADGRIQVNEKANNGCTALHLAACKGHTDCVKALVAAEGTKVNEKANNGCTALHYAADNGHTDCARELLAADGIKVNEKTRCGPTALDCACANGHTACKKLLLENGAHQSACLLQ